MTIKSKIKRSHESSEHQHVYLQSVVLKFLAQLQFELKKIKCCTVVHRKYQKMLNTEHVKYS